MDESEADSDEAMATFRVDPASEPADSSLPTTSPGPDPALQPDSDSAAEVDDGHEAASDSSAASPL
jgi:hypothetical protein